MNRYQLWIVFEGECSQALLALESALIPSFDATFLTRVQFEERLTASSGNAVQPELILFDETMDQFSALARSTVSYFKQSKVILGVRQHGTTRYSVPDAVPLPLGAASTLDRILLLAKSARQRRKFRTTIDRMNTEISAPQFTSVELSKLIVSDRYLASILVSAEDAIISINLDGEIISWNAGAARLFQQSEQAVLGMSIAKIASGEWPRRFPDILEQVKNGDAVVKTELQCALPDHTIIDTEASFAPVGKLVAISAIVRDISSRKKNERELRHAMAEAESDNRAKDEFLAVISHELRTPMTSILGWSKLLQSGKCGAQLNHGLQVIERNAKAQARMVDELLDMTRINTGKLVLSLQTFHVNAVVEATLEAIRPAADAKKIKLLYCSTSPVDIIRGDPDRLQQVFYNLLMNAIKFTPKNGTVTVLDECSDSSYMLTVADSGIGIEPEFIPYVFDRFTQADYTSTREFQGLGLGLSIVRQLVELHGGTVTVTSPGKDRGSTFSLKLPIAATLPSVAHTEQRVTESAIPAAKSMLTNVSVLLVEDDADSRQLLTEVLQQAGAQVYAAESAREAIQLLQDVTPELIISDIGLPEEDGYALLSKLRAIDRFQKIPVIALTAFARSDDRKRILSAGFQSHITKPVDPDVLISAAAKFVERQNYSPERVPL